ncbi:MAG TPA: methyltransferase [Candidatus Latescibacteria bacterium]|nr:methyltransferase [Candidatus Latescibacterota bacterium]HJP32257.1 methyltransferase [Candidatus Latescibacterota bacterium]
MPDRLTSEWIRPEPVTAISDVRQIERHDDAARVAQALCEGERACVADLYSTGLTILAEVRRHLQPGGKPLDYAGSRAFRRTYQQASQRLLAPIADHQIALRKAPSIGWLEELYPHVGDFHLSFPHLQGLNSSWQWYTRGIDLPVIEPTLHPFYGTYFPTRFEHLELFAEWLQGYQGKRDLAYDIGTGCGVLALQLSAAGCAHVIATDTNPNAIESVRRDLHELTPAPAITPIVSDLFGQHQAAADLIVFNPPWLCGEAHGPLDQAMYFAEGFFERFFHDAGARMHHDARLVLIFSNLRQQTSDDTMNPIQAELDSNSRFELVQKLEAGVRPSSKKTRRRQRSVEQERVEVWELRLTN